jgi:hypothetical protein
MLLPSAVEGGAGEASREAGANMLGSCMPCGLCGANVTSASLKDMVSAMEETDVSGSICMK